MVGRHLPADYGLWFSLRGVEGWITIAKPYWSRKVGSHRTPVYMHKVKKSTMLGP